jgi:hypothetical protein
MYTAILLFAGWLGISARNTFIFTLCGTETTTGLPTISIYHTSCPNEIFPFQAARKGLALFEHDTIKKNTLWYIPP